LRGPIGRPPTYDAYREFVAASELYWRGNVVDAVAGFRRAATLDSTFLAAAMSLITTSVTIDRCDIADSVIREMERRRVPFAQADLLTLRGRQSRCNRDWDQGVMDMRARTVAEPWSTLPQWAISANLRRANRPAEAIAVLRSLDPTRDLGWISDDGKVMYWRELAWAQHMLADVAGQQEAVVGLKRMAAGRLATAYFAALERVSAGKPNEVVQALDGVEALPPDPAIAMGEIAGRSPPDRVGTPAWVLYQVGTELLSMGDSAGAVELARRAVRWLDTRSAAEQAHLEGRYQRVLALELAGELDSALRLVRQLSQAVSDNIEIRGRLGIIAARRGDQAQARAVDAWLARHPPVQPAGVPQLERARIAAVLGERDRALELIETLPFRAHPVDVVMFHSDPAFASLRSDARWIRLLKPRG
jgi:tetratricopeptide (TPR) repeat protein